MHLPDTVLVSVARSLVAIVSLVLVIWTKAKLGELKVLTNTSPRQRQARSLYGSKRYIDVLSINYVKFMHDYTII